MMWVLDESVVHLPPGIPTDLANGYKSLDQRGACAQAP